MFSSIAISYFNYVQDNKNIISVEEISREIINFSKIIEKSFEDNIQK